MAEPWLLEEWSNPRNKYTITDLDSSGDTKYFGFVDQEGAWYIMQLTTTAARYIRGASNYAANWTNRASLTYDYFDTIF